MKKTILFYVHNFGWLWHNKRISLIIKELLGNFPNYNAIILNSWKKQDYLFQKIEGLKIINLPNYEFDNYTLSWDFNRVKKLRMLIYKKLFSLSLDIESLVVEHYPFGRNFLDTEIHFLISEFRKFNSIWSVFSSVRDIIDINSLNKENLVLFDRFLFHSDRMLINYENEIDKNIQKKIIYTGYVTESIEIKMNKKINIIYVNIWWWQDGIEVIVDFLSKLDHLKMKMNYKVIVSLWENYNEENISLLQSIFTGDIVFHKFLNNSLQLKMDSVLVISMGGYNNMVESLRYNIRTIVYPRNTDLEQKERLKKFQEISWLFLSGYALTVDYLEELLLAKSEQSNENKIIQMDWSYFSASFLVNYKKYKYIKIRLTNACNAKCDMCWVIKRKWEYNDIEKIEQSVRDFYRLGWEVVNFTWGEPTIYKGFWKLLEISKQLWLITSVSTNGSTLGDWFLKNLLQSWRKTIDFIDISVDWLFEKQDVRRRYNGLFNIIHSNIKKLLDLDIYIHINVTIRKDNILEMRDIFVFFKELWVNSISFWLVENSPVNDISALIPDKNALIRYYLKDKQYIINNAWNIKITFSQDISKILGKSNSINMENIDGFYQKVGVNCSFINSKKEIRINENGEITPCCILDDYDEELWNINKLNLIDIVCSRTYESFLSRKFPNISQACLTCNIIA